MGPLKNTSQLVELVADLQLQVAHQVESKLHQTLVVVEQVAVVVSPSDHFVVVVCLQLVVVVAAERNFENLYINIVD